MKRTKIEWCHHTVNFWWGCVKVSLACLHCYAETLAKLFSRGRASWGPNGLRWIRTAAALRELLRLNKDAHKRGVVERVFVNSMSDTFEDRRDLDGPRSVLFSAATQLTNLQLLLLTKRPENICRMVPVAWVEDDGWPSNVWIGTTVENQEMADKRIPILLDVPAPVRFLSMEPLLGPVDLTALGHDDQRGLNALSGEFRYYRDDDGEPCSDWGPSIQWVIVGGESGGGARPMHPSWARKLHDHCLSAGVPFFFKQWGEYLPQDQRDAITFEWVVGHSDKRNHDWEPSGFASIRIGKKAAGRELDGQHHDAVPVP